MQHAKRMRRIILSSVACPNLPGFSTFSLTQRGFRQMLLNIKCVFSLFLQL